jgi:hypothetical protein
MFTDSCCGPIQPFRGVVRDIFSFFSGLTEVLMWAFSGAFEVSPQSRLPA